jgi:hypothetical protein
MQQSPSTSTAQSSTTSDNWAATWDANANNNNGAAINRTVNNTPRQSTAREAEVPSSSRIGSSSQDARNTAAKPADSWTDDSWSRNSAISPNRIDATIGASKTAGVGSSVNSAPAIQSPINAPPVNSGTIGSTGNNVNFGGPSPSTPQQPMNVNAAKPAQAPAAPGEPQPWVTLLVAILGLAGSLAGNIYLGWSYLDARQKYQALVRRTADTFRRTKVAA